MAYEMESFVFQDREYNILEDLLAAMAENWEEGKESLSHYPPARKFQEGDIVWVVGEEESLDALLTS